MLILKFIGSDGNFNLKHGVKYPCKIYTKGGRFICVRVRNYALRFPKKYVYIYYLSLNRLSNEWVNEEGSGIL